MKQYITSDSEGYTLCIPVNEQFEGVLVESVTMYVAKDEDEGDGDLAVNWSVEGLENTGGGDMGSLLMRGWNDEVGSVMGLFYWEHAYDERLQEILVDAGFPEAVATVSGSEWGMQDEGRASYDAPALAQAVRAAMQ